MALVAMRLSLESAKEILHRFGPGAADITHEELVRAMHAIVLKVEQEVVDRTPIDTGRLQGSIASEVMDLGERILGIIASAGVIYAPFVEFGTRAHVIRARADPNNPRHSLAFPGRNGQLMFRRQVNHPGTQGVHMFELGFEASRTAIEGYLLVAARRIAARLVGQDPGIVL